MLRLGAAALLMILLAAPASAGSRAGGGFHGGFHGGGFHGGGFHPAFQGGGAFHGESGFHDGGGGGFHGGGFHPAFQAGGAFHGESGFHDGGGGGFHGGGFAFRRGIAVGLGLAGVYGNGYGYNCGFGFDCGVYSPGYSYGGGAGNAVIGSGDLSDGSGYSGGYVPDPVGADIPPVVFPTPCWVRRNGYDPSGAYVGQVLIDLCRPSDSVTVTRVDARAKPPATEKGTGEPPPVNQPAAPQPSP